MPETKPTAPSRTATTSEVKLPEAALEDPRGYVGTSPDETPREVYALPHPGKGADGDADRK